MTILLLNAPNTLNYGSMMLAENFIHYFDPQGKHRFLIETDRPEETIGRLQSATGHGALEAFTGLDGLLSGKARMLAGTILPLRVRVDAELAVVLGGDDFTEDHGWRALVSQILRLNLLDMPLWFVGQSMGPFASFRKPFCKWMLSRAKRILLRDSISYACMESLGLKNIARMPDLAFAPLHGEEESETERKGALFFPSELLWRFSSERDRERCLDFYEHVLRSLLTHYAFVEMLPHVLRPEGSDDRRMVTDLARRLSSDKLRFDNEPRMPSEIRARIRASRAVVTGRMHPAVSSVACGTPVIAFAYSEKYHGVVAKDCGLDDFVLDVRRAGASALAEDFDRALAKLLSQEDALQSRLSALSREKAGEVRRVMEGLWLP